MRRLPKQQSVGKCTQWALGCGAVFLSARAVLHGLDAPTVIAAIAAITAITAGAAGAAAAAASGVLAALPGIIAELRAKKVACIKAKTDARVALEGSRRRTAVVNAALNGKLEAAVGLLKLLMLDDQVHALSKHSTANRSALVSVSTAART